MLRYRLLTGTLLAAGVAAELVADARLAPYFPILFALSMVCGVVTCLELVALLPADHRPDRSAVVPGTLGVLASNWYAPVRETLGSVPLLPTFADSWQPVIFTFTLVVLAAFLHEIYHFRGPGTIAVRLAMTTWIVAYLGLLSSFLLKLRWLDGNLDPAFTGWLLVLVIFVPKCADIGAYFTGRLIGRTPFSPLISPKKTWEGFAGGLALAALTAVGIDAVVPIFRYGAAEAIGFGVIVGTTGVLGDLGESLVKRDCGTKDASQRLPGFGGLLDVMDSILFAAPVAYLWLARN
jgi:phosphatidate cytidylyltransferase